MRSFLMAVREILCLPDPRLRAVAERVSFFDDALRSLADDLLVTMRPAPGIGMTAPHVGVLRRLVVIELPGEPVRFYVNPQIEWSPTEMARHAEGSVSMPGVTDDVERPARIRLRYEDLFGREEAAEASGLLAVCLQHEIDQLDGIFWLYRLSRLRRDRLIKRFAKLRRGP
jgi:peptide deformylase